jgi:hypothetical protein
MGDVLRIPRGKAMWAYLGSNNSYSAPERIEVFSRQYETNPAWEQICLGTSRTDTGPVPPEVVVIQTTPGRSRPLVRPYPYEETVDTSEWLGLTQETLDFWDNETDAGYDDL